MYPEPGTSWVYEDFPRGTTVDITPQVSGNYTYSVGAMEVLDLKPNKNRVYARTDIPLTCTLPAGDNTTIVDISGPQVATAILSIEKVTSLMVDPTPTYAPPSMGTLTQVAGMWVYTSWMESRTAKYCRPMYVHIVAKVGGQEVGRKKILVMPAFEHIKTVAAITGSWICCFEFLQVKYAAAIALTKGGFSSVTCSPSPTITCRWKPADACTDVLSGVEFGTDSWETENVGASTICHELLHTGLGGDATECEAYHWELQNKAVTGLDSTDNTGSLQGVLLKIQESCD